MRILVAPDKFKGSLSAVEAAELIRDGWRQQMPAAEFDLVPIADGGEGTCEAIARAIKASWVQADAIDPIGRRIRARYLWHAEAETAYLELAEASGLHRLRPQERNPRATSTFGTGLLIKDALGRGAKKICVGLGGSATNDAGAGLAAALGWKFLGADGQLIAPEPRHFSKIKTIERPSEAFPATVIAITDVENPLLGRRGSSLVFGPQKGASQTVAAQLDASLKSFADLVEPVTGQGLRDHPGAGAAGGAGFGLLAFFNAKLMPGFQFVAETLGMEQRAAAADLVITGEGSLDSQSLEGKAPVALARLAHRQGKPTIAFAGRVEGWPEGSEPFAACFAIANGPMTLEQSTADARTLLKLAAARVAAAVQIPL